MRLHRAHPRPRRGAPGPARRVARTWLAADGALAGSFSDDRRITDPRGLSLDPARELVYLNSGDHRVLALDRNGNVALDSGRIGRLDPGGGTFGPDGRYYVGLRSRRTILALPALLDREGEVVLPDGIVPFPRGFGFGADGLTVAQSGTVVVSSEWPCGSPRRHCEHP